MTALPNSLKSFDFENRSVLRVDEIADRMRVSVRHVLNWVDEGTLPAVDASLAGPDGSRRTIRVTIEAYRAFILARDTISGP